MNDKINRISVYVRVPEKLAIAVKARRMELNLKLNEYIPELIKKDLDKKRGCKQNG